MRNFVKFTVSFAQFFNPVFSILGAVLLASCASPPPKPKVTQPPPVAEEVEEAPTPEKKPEATQTSAPKGEQFFVISTLTPASVIQGNVNNQVLSSAIIELEELVRKYPDDVSLVVTFLSLLRMSGNGSDIQRSLSRAAGSNGAKNPWFLLEAAYGAIIRKEFALADYLLGKAQRFSSGNDKIKSAVAHAWGVRYLVAGKSAEGIFEMRKGAAANFFPSLLTLGFLALRSGDYIGAERYFRFAAASTGDNLNAKMGLGIALRVRGKSDEAFPLLQQVYKRLPNDRRVAWNYALALSEAPGKKGEAIEVLNKYFQLPGSLGEVDGRANTLLQKLQAPPQRAAPAPLSSAPATGGTAQQATPPKPSQGNAKSPPVKK